MDVKELRVETPLTNYMFSKASSAKIPISGTFELSPVCNFQCQMCYVRKTRAEVAAHDRPLMTVERWLEIAREAREKGMLYLLLTGGEPFLWPNFWKLYEKLSRMGFLISINTNGSLIDEKAIERLKKMPPTRINITLYGAGDDSYERLCGVTGAFAKVDQAIRKLREAGITVKLNGSLTPENVCDLEKCSLYAKEQGLIYETNTYMFPPVRRDESMIGKNKRFTPKEAACYRLKSYRLQFGDEMYAKYLQSIEDGYVPPLGLDESCIDPQTGNIRCRAGKAAFWITWDGWLTPCGMMTKPKVELKGKSFGDAWKELTEISGKLGVSGACLECKNRKICHSCAAMAIAETGDSAHVPKYLCEMVLEMKNLASEQLTGLKNEK